MAKPAEELDDADFYEVVRGQVIRIPPMSSYAGHVADRLNAAVTLFLHAGDQGECGIGYRFQIPQPDDPTQKRRPRWSYLSFDRWAKNRPIPYYTDGLNVVPDVVAEVVSPDDTADDLIAKARLYLRGGVRLVWLVYPLTQEIHAYLPDVKDIRVYFAGDALEAPNILPGFQAPVASLFPPMEAVPAMPDET